MFAGATWTGMTATLVALASCSTPAPRPLVMNRDVCTHCHMTAADPRFGAELVTTTGKILAFDDAGCLARFLASGAIPAGRIHSLWVQDYLEPHGLVPADSAVFLVSDSLKTPMDHRAAAVAPGARADSLEAALGATRVAWPEFRQLAWIASR